MEVKNFTDLFKKTWYLFRSNLILLLPPAIVSILSGIVVIVGIIVMAILLSLSGVFHSKDFEQMFLYFFKPLILGGSLGLLFLGLLWIANLAGWVNMYKVAVRDGKTTLKDYLSGIGKYFFRILGGVILQIVIWGALLGIALFLILKVILGADFAYFLSSLFKSPGLAGQELSQLLEALSPPAILGIVGIVFLWIILEVLVSLLLIFWKQACSLDELKVIPSFEASIEFVLSNFLTVLGVIAVQIGLSLILSITTGITVFLLFLLLGTFGGEEETLIGLLSLPLNLLQGLFSYILSVYFTLLYFVLYDKKLEDRGREGGFSTGL